MIPQNQHLNYMNFSFLIFPSLQCFHILNPSCHTVIASGCSRLDDASIYELTTKCTSHLKCLDNSYCYNITDKSLRLLSQVSEEFRVYFEVKWRFYFIFFLNYILLFKFKCMLDQYVEFWIVVQPGMRIFRKFVFHEILCPILLIWFSGCFETFSFIFTHFRKHPEDSFSYMYNCVSTLFI